MWGIFPVKHVANAKTPTIILVCEETLRAAVSGIYRAKVQRSSDGCRSQGTQRAGRNFTTGCSK